MKMPADIDQQALSLTGNLILTALFLLHLIKHSPEIRSIAPESAS
ncbi:MAG: hypothetical protein OFPI_29870 [Osedax symbiont Rs2]|nr:MAG: hypothetical protein OFPI_29870 [Osedax symbiont Rs2]